MSSLEVNKIVAALLTAGIVASGSGFFASLLYHPEMPEAHAYAIGTDAGAGAEAETAAVVEGPPLGELLAAADLGAGEKAIKKCTACHTFDNGGAHKIGPNLWNIVERPIAGAEGFAFSSALQDRGAETWSYDNLDGFLAKPKDWAPGTKMSFAGLRKAGQRADLLAYLRTLSDTPVPLPE